MAEAGCDALILRTAWLYPSSETTSSGRLLRLTAQTPRVKVRSSTRRERPRTPQTSPGPYTA
ncbi:MAG: hypothetical protein ACLTZY_10110 [Alistipes indistinctus]